MVVAGTIEEISGQEWADEATKAATAVGEAEDRAKVPAGKEVLNKDTYWKLVEHRDRL